METLALHPDNFRLVLTNSVTILPVFVVSASTDPSPISPLVPRLVSLSDHGLL